MSDDKSSHIFLNLLKEKAKEGVNVYLSVDRINDLSFERKMKNELQESGVHFTYSRKPELPFGFILFIIVIIAVLRRLMGRLAIQADLI